MTLPITCKPAWMKRAFKCNYDAVSIELKTAFLLQKILSIPDLQIAEKHPKHISDYWEILHICCMSYICRSNSEFLSSLFDCQTLFYFVRVSVDLVQEILPFGMFRKKGFNFGLLILDSHLLASFVFFYLTLLVAVV